MLGNMIERGNKILRVHHARNSLPCSETEKVPSYGQRTTTSLQYQQVISNFSSFKKKRFDYSLINLRSKTIILF